jgi:hypothetical protein
VNAYGSPDVHQATRFVRCEFEDQEHPDYGRPFTGSALIEVYGDNVSLVDCSLYVDTLSREVIRGCHILHRNDTLAPGDFQALVRGSALEHTSFAGAFARTPAMPYFVSNDSVNLGAGVRVEGEGLTWGLDGKTGLIAGP